MINLCFIKTNQILSKMKRLLLTLLLACAAQVALAQDVITYRTDQTFDDVVFGLENAILDQGLIVDQVSHVGEMLARTGQDVGSDTKIFEAANVYLFCSAVLSRKMMEADPLNIGFCPYGVFVAEGSEGVRIGFRAMPAGAMQEVHALLDEIAREAAEIE
mgnify:CR=1 FL=1